MSAQRMFWQVFRFELSFHVRQPMIYVVSLIFLLLAFGATVSDNITVGGVADNVNINSPFNVVATLAVWTLLCVFGCIAYAASPVLRDFEYHVAELFLTTRIRKFDYLAGRFCGALVFCYWLYFMALLGMLLGEFMPWLDPERLGPLRLDAYWFATWAIAVPNILFVSGLVFFIATLTRSLMASYVAVIALLIVNALISSLVDPEQVRLLSMLDPFGLEAIASTTRYWTPFQRNAEIVPLSGNLLLNRALVAGLFVVFTGAAYRLFRFSLEGFAAPRWWGRRRRREETQVEERAARWGAPLEIRAVHRDFTAGTRFRQFLALTAMETGNIFKAKAFAVFALLGVMLVVLNAVFGIQALFGTDLYPTTAALVTIINGSYSLPLLVVLVFYSSELLYRDKAAHVNEIVDSMPFPDSVALAAKLLGLAAAVAAMLVAAMAGAIAVQVGRGFFDIDLLHYFLGLFVFFQFPLWMTCVVALFLQVVTGNKYLGMLFTVLYLIGIFFVPNLGFDQYLYIPNIPPAVHSDFTGYELGLGRFVAFSVYWGFFLGLLLVAAHLLWPRGTDSGRRFSRRSLGERFGRPVQVVTVVCLLGFVSSGVFNYYNTNVLNDHVSGIQREEQQARYEKAYKIHEHRPLPQIEDVSLHVDIFPGRREAHAEGYYVLTNRSDAPIDQLHLTLRPYLTINELTFPGATQTLNDRELGYTIFELERSMAPGESRRLTFDIDWLTPGFANSIRTPKLLSNGTFFDSTDILPLPGYQKSFELGDNNDRRKYDLPPVERAANIDDQAAHQRAQLGVAYRTGYEAVVSTAAGQTAVTPGYLVEDWEENGRHYFHYRMDAPIWPFVSFLSADYRVARSRWQDVDIEVYYHHDYNVQAMLDAAEKSLAYFSKHFSPYQYRQYRIFEFPAPIGRFAQSFPNTIPFSESIGFVADIRDPEEIDYVFYVTAHELAHQWWAHQEIGADVQGATMLTETLSQYSALMVAKHEFGEDTMQRFLRYELDRYLQGRGAEIIEELPLMLVENQPYIHYRKGSVVLYALQDYLGEDTVNRVLHDFVGEWGFKGPPFPTTRDLIARFREAAGPEYQDLITDLFEKIVVYDLKVADGSYRTLDDGRYEVTFSVDARKYEADGEGRETQVPIGDFVDIAVLGEEQGDAKLPEVLYLERRSITDEAQTFTVVVDKPPEKVGIDPYNKLIDRNPEDNRKSIFEAQSGAG